MQIKTHRVANGDISERSSCEFCDRYPLYWSQAEDGEAAKSRCVWHCQKHRNNARETAQKHTKLYGVYRTIQLIKIHFKK